MIRDCEFSCDEMVISHLGETERRTYGKTLLHSIVINQLGDIDVVSLSLNKDGQLIKERLGAIMRYHRKSRLVVFMAVILTSVLLCGTVYAGAYLVENTKKIKKILPHTVTASEQTVVYDRVEINRNEGKEKFNYLTNVRTNHTTKKIVSCDRAMLAFDKDGNPLELDWWTRDDELNYHFLWRHGGLAREVLPGQKDEQTRGWRLNAELDPQVQKVAYVLFCDIEITFEDGTVWKNPEYENWRAAYEGEKVDVTILDHYYPYQEEITTTK